VLINAPKRAGKTTFANMIRQEFHDTAVIGMSYHLKRFVHGIYLGQQGFALDPDAFDAIKELPQDLLGGMSWRQAYIHYSENVIKPLHGKEWFGAQLLRQARETGADLIAVPDSGFIEETNHVIKNVGAQNVLLCRMYRRDCKFDSTDSRGYIYPEGVKTVEIVNREDDLLMLRDQCKLVKDWLASCR
jgi:hypothetical protein